MISVLSKWLCVQLTKTTNRCHVSPSMQEKCVRSRRLPWQWGLCAVPGCQPVCPRVRFPSNLHLTFRLTAFLSPFSLTYFLWGDYLRASARTYWFRWLTHTQGARAGSDETRCSPPLSRSCAGSNFVWYTEEKLEIDLCACRELKEETDYAYSFL